MAAVVQVVGGVDPHADTIHVAVLTAIGRPIGDAGFPTTAEGYQAAVAFLTGAGAVLRVGVEGAAGYGAGITRALTAAHLVVVEVERPTRSARRRAGKSDRLDAYHAAQAVLAGRSSPVKDQAVEGLRALHLARRSAVKARTATINQIHAIVIMAPEPIRARFRNLSGNRLVTAVGRYRGSLADPVTAEVVAALKLLADRHRHLSGQIGILTGRIDALVTAANPGLRAAVGVGPDTAAQLLITAGHNPQRLGSEASFAALCGVAPVPASSGKTSRHRLSRGGDRAANAALHRIAVSRMRHDPRTRAYAAAQKARRRGGLEILRLLKRAIAREIYRLLTRQIPVPSYADLRPARQARNITLTAAARHFDVYPTLISRLERGQHRNDTLAENYRAWLTAA
jgi:transposase